MIRLSSSLLPTPSHHREWTGEHAVLPRFRVEDGVVTVEGVRNFRWHDGESGEPRWETRSYRLEHLHRLWLAVTPFTTLWRGPAHTLLSFQFGEDTFLAVSVEARREVGETFGIVKGMLRRFELIYVAGDERDLVGLRAVHRPDQVFLYPVRVREEGVRTIFLQVAGSANRLLDHPEFYHTVTNNCTTRIVDHVNAVTPRRIPRWDWRILIPGYSDALAWKLGLLDVEGTVAQARRRWFVNHRAERWIDAPDFSLRIRWEDGDSPPDSPLRTPLSYP